MVLNWQEDRDKKELVKKQINVLSQALFIAMRS